MRILFFIFIVTINVNATKNTRVTSISNRTLPNDLVAVSLDTYDCNNDRQWPQLALFLTAQISVTL